jgi:GNAT superfamily N-acetyltransferase
MGKKASPDFGYRRYHDDHEEQLKQIKWKFKNVSNMETLLTANLNKGQVGHLFLGRYGDQLTVREIGIDEVWRGTGLGQMLYDRAIQYGKEKGYKYFYSDFEGTRSDDAESAWKRLRQRYPVQTDEASQRYFIPLTQATKAASDKTPPGSERTEYPEDSNGWALFPDKREGTSMAPSLNKLIPENEKD